MGGDFSSHWFIGGGSGQALTIGLNRIFFTDMTFSVKCKPYESLIQ